MDVHAHSHGNSYGDAHNHAHAHGYVGTDRYLDADSCAPVLTWMQARSGLWELRGIRRDVDVDDAGGTSLLPVPVSMH